LAYRFVRYAITLRFRKKSAREPKIIVAITRPIDITEIAFVSGLTSRLSIDMIISGTVD
jgi:hypothetical protein